MAELSPRSDSGPACDGCGAALRDRVGGRRWCSDRCRKDTLYGGTCEVCGAPTDGSNGRAAAPRRCKAHNGGADKKRSRFAERVRHLIELREQGLTDVQIARETGDSPDAVRSAFSNARRRGIVVPRAPYWDRAVS